MKKHLLNFKTILFCFLVLISPRLNAQTIVETFDSAPWSNATTSNGTSIAVTIAATATNQTITSYSNNNYSASVTATTTQNNTTGTFTWYYSKASISSASSTANSGHRKHSNYYSLMMGSSSSYVITPTITNGIASVSFWISTSSNTSPFFVGLKTNLTNTNIASSAMSLGVGGTVGLASMYTINDIPSTMSSSHYSFTFSQTDPAQIVLFNNTSSTIYLDDIVISAPSNVPTITVTPATLSGFTYVDPSGPSAQQSFDVSGTNLTNDIVLTPPADYEISTVSGAGFTPQATITLTQTAGSVASTPIYVRLKNGLAIGTYNAQLINATSTGASSKTVTLSGSVTSGALIQLTTPVLTGASSVADVSFTANWNAVPNATGYAVLVYNGATLVDSVYIGGQATISLAVSGLTASTSYTYKVRAIGDGLTYSNSNQSAASAFTTIATVMPTACDIPLYYTDFTDWGKLNVWAGGTTVNDAGGSSVGSSDPFTGTLAGAGFSLSGKPAVDPVASLGGDAGYIFYGNSTCSAPNYYLTFKPFNFICGGVVQVEVFANTTSARKISIPGATKVSIDEVPADVTRFDRQLVDGVANGISGGTLSTTPMAGSTWTFQAQTTGIFKATFYLPSTVTGSQTLYIGDLSALQACALTKLRVCSSVCTQKIVASTNFGTCTDDDTGLSLQATKGGAFVSGIVNVKGWNLTAGATLSITGTDAALFSLPVTTLTQAEALAGQSITVKFTPSVMTGVSNAQLIISSSGAPNYCVSLTGLTQTGATPEITTPVQTWNFATQVIGTVTQNIPISGINLTGPVTFTITGTNASQFTLGTSTMSISDATAGTSLAITYLGGTSSPLTQNANLVISSPGAASVTIPLAGLTYATPPTMYTLTKTVTPSGSGYITQDIGGTTFASGTTVKVTAVPQTGYKFVRWQDNGSTALTRTLLMTSNKSIIAEFAPGTGLTVVPFYAYTPNTITNTSFTARWQAVSGATTYTVSVYDKNGTLLLTMPSTSSTTQVVTGLTQGTLYSYKVTSDVSGDVSNVVGNILTTGTAVVPACGDVN